MKIFRIDKYMDELKLIEDCIAAKPRAQKYLFDKYSTKFLALSNRYISENNIAEDILMESFMKIFNSLSKFNKQGSLEGWMRKIIVNECLNYLRKNKNIFISIEEKNIDFEDVNIDLSSSKNKALALINILKKLPEGYRSVFNLYVIEGYKHKEISQLLNISESTSKTQLHKAKKLIKSSLDKMPLKNEEHIDEYDLIKYLNISNG